MRDHGLKRDEYLLLYRLSHFAELTAQEVTKMTERPRNSISRAVHRKLKEGYLNRSPHPTDVRQILLRVASKGRNLHERVLPRFVSREKEIFLPLNQHERTVPTGSCKSCLKEFLNNSNGAPLAGR